MAPKNPLFTIFFQRMCATLGLLFPTIAFDIAMGNNGVNTPLNTEVYCGTYLNTIAGMRAGGVVTCKIPKHSSPNENHVAHLLL